MDAACGKKSRSQLVHNLFLFPRYVNLLFNIGEQLSTVLSSRPSSASAQCGSRSRCFGDAPDFTLSPRAKFAKGVSDLGFPDVYFISDFCT